MPSGATLLSIVPLGEASFGVAGMGGRVGSSQAHVTLSFMPESQ